MRSEVLRLYKDILRYGQKLKYTDKDYFKSRVKVIFRDNQSLGDPQSVDFQIQKGRTFLERKKVV